MTPRSWTLDVRGLPLVVWELSADDADGPPVVCLHGWLDQGLAYATLAQDKPGRWLALDQRGHGRSGHVGAGGYYHFGDYLGDLDALVRALGRPVRLVGHSMGATVASMYAGARPDLVERLVLIDGLGALEASDPSPLSRMRQHLDGLAHPPSVGRMANVEAAAERLTRRHVGLPLDHARLLATHGTVPVGGPVGGPDGAGVRWSFDPLHMTRAPTPFREDFYEEFLRAITAPTLVIWASESWYPPEVRDRRGGWIAGATTAVVPGGHMLLYTSAPALAQVIGPFLA